MTKTKPAAHTRRHTGSKLFAFALCCSTALTATPALAADFTWQNGTNSWTNIPSWDGGAVPAGGDAAIINNGGTAQIGAGVTATPMNIHLGSAGGNSGQIDVNGANAALNNSSEIYVGLGGTGTINITGGGDVTTQSGYLGNNNGSNGTVTVDGAGSTWASSNFMWVGNSGTGTLTIKNGGEVKVNNGAGTVNIAKNGASTGTINIGAASGEAAAAAGTLTAANVTFGGGGGGCKLIFNHTATDYVFSQDINGGSCTEIIKLEAGTTRFTGDMSDFASDGGSIYVDGGNTAILDISNGSTTKSKEGFIGQTLNKQGTVNVTGSGSKWVNSDTLYLGKNGTATLNITAGGHVTNGHAALSEVNGSTAVVTVDGDGSLWASSGDLYIGYSGAGTLNIKNSGDVTSATGYIGYNNTSTSTATVDGNGSKWAIGNTFYVGNSGKGTLTLKNAGILQVDNDGNTGNGIGGTVTIAKENGSTGTLNIGAAAGSTAAAPGTISASTVAFGTGTGTLNFNHTSTALDFTLPVTGGGAIKLSGGATEISGDLSGHTGAITIDGGTLIVNNDWSAKNFTFTSGGIKGTGTTPTLTAPASGMTLAPGNSVGTLNVSGNLTLNNNSVFEVEFNNTAADKVIVSGTATIDGKIKYLPESASYTSGTEYTILQAGTLTGNFDTQEIVNESRLSGLAITTTASTVTNTVKMKLGSAAFQPETSGNKKTSHSTAGYVDTVRGSATGDLKNLIDKLATLPTSQLDAAMEAISGKRTEAATKTEGVYNKAVADAVNSRQLIMVGSPFGSGPGAGAPAPTAPTANIPSASGTTVTTGDTINPTSGFANSVASIGADNLLGLTEDIDGDLTLLETGGDGYGVWVRAFGRMGSEDADIDQTGYEYGLGGFVGGVDYRFSDKLTAGVMLAHGQTNVTLDNDGGGSDVKTYNLGGYGTYTFANDVFANGLLMLGYNDIENQRHITFTGYNELANGDTDSYTVRVETGLGKRFVFNGFNLLPTAKVGYSWSQQSGYDETGAPGANLHYDEQTTKTFIAEIAGEVSREFKTKDGATFTPYIGFAAMLDDPLDDRRMQSGFVGSSTYAVNGNADSTLSASPRAGLTHKATNGLIWSADYLGEYDHAGTAHSFSAGIRYEF